MDKYTSKKQNMSIILMQGILPLCIYYLVNQCVVILGMSTIQFGLPNLQADSMAEMYLRTAVQMTGMFLAAFSLLPFYKRETKIFEKMEEKQGENTLSVRNGFLIVFMGALFSLGLNFMFSVLGFLQSSPGYNQVAQRQFSLPFWLAFLFYGILSPWAEELVFRGVFYRVLKRNMTEAAAVLGSALMFGAFHGNLVQLLYGSMMGVVMALLYGRFQNLLAPVLFHGAANIAIYTVSYFF